MQANRKVCSVYCIAASLSFDIILNILFHCFFSLFRFFALTGMERVCLVRPNGPQFRNITMRRRHLAIFALDIVNLRRKTWWLLLQMVDCLSWTSMLTIYARVCVCMCAHIYAFSWSSLYTLQKNKQQII